MVESSPAGCSRRGAGAGTGAGPQSMRKQVECPDCAVCARVAVERCGRRVLWPPSPAKVNARRLETAAAAAACQVSTGVALLQLWLRDIMWARGDLG